MTSVGQFPDKLWLEAWDLPYACTHPIVVDERLVPFDENESWWRECALCGFGYNRTETVLAPLAAQCRQAWSVDFGRVSRAVRDEGEWRHEEFVP